MRSPQSPGRTRVAFVPSGCGCPRYAGTSATGSEGEDDPLGFLDCRGGSARGEGVADRQDFHAGPGQLRGELVPRSSSQRQDDGVDPVYMERLAAPEVADLDLAAVDGANDPVSGQLDAEGANPRHQVRQLEVEVRF